MTYWDNEKGEFSIELDIAVEERLDSVVVSLSEYLEELLEEENPHKSHQETKDTPFDPQLEQKKKKRFGIFLPVLPTRALANHVSARSYSLISMAQRALVSGCTF